MTEKKHLSIRLDSELRAKLEAEAERVSKETGMDFTISDIARRIIAAHYGRR